MDLEFWQILILAAVQGVTEFLPISSSGHLVILAHLLAGGDAGQLDVVELNIVLHLGTLLSILVFYWQRILRLMREDRRVVGLLMVGTVPAVLLGVPLKVFASGWLEQPLLAGLLLPVTGGILLLSNRSRENVREYQDLGWGRAFAIGVGQAVAILPGLSRSGTTIVTGLGLGLTPRSAATFSFLLAIPAIGGAGLLEVASAARSGASFSGGLENLAAGLVVSFAVGLVSLWWLVRWVERGRLQWFAWWCIPVGIAVVIWQLLGRV